MSAPITSEDYLQIGLDWLEKDEFVKCILDFNKALELDLENASAYGEIVSIKNRHLRKSKLIQTMHTST